MESMQNLSLVEYPVALNESPFSEWQKVQCEGKTSELRNIYFCSGCGSGAILSNLCGQNCKRLIPHLPPVSWRSLHVTQHCRLILSLH